MKTKAAYRKEQLRLLDHLETTGPDTDEYKQVMKRLDQLDQILNRTTEFNKTLIPAVTSVAAVGGIYVLQQFGGVLVPKVLDLLTTRKS